MEFTTALTVVLSLLVLMIAHQVVMRSSLGFLREVYNDYDAAVASVRLGATVLFLLAAGAAGLFLWWLATVTPTSDLTYLGLGLSGSALLLGLVFGAYFVVLVHLRNERERVATQSSDEW